MGFRPQRREPLPEAAEDRRQAGGPEPAGGASDLEAVVRPARPRKGGPATNPGPAEFQSCSPGWSSAFYEADCFGADIHSYVRELGGRKAGGAPDPSGQVSVGPPPMGAGPGGPCPSRVPVSWRTGPLPGPPLPVPTGPVAPAQARAPSPCSSHVCSILGEEMAFLSLSVERVAPR